jgi:hypothetical protein
MSLLLWCVMAATGARRRRRPGLLYGSVVAANLVSGTPAALERVRERRRDPVAVLAPHAVGAAVLTGLRGGWPSAATAAVLGVLGIAERTRTTESVIGEVKP